MVLERRRRRERARETKLHDEAIELDYLILIDTGATTTTGDVLPDSDVQAEAFLAARSASINEAFATPATTGSFLAARVTSVNVDAVQVVVPAEVAASPSPPPPPAPEPATASPPSPPGGGFGGTETLSESQLSLSPALLAGVVAGVVVACLLAAIVAFVCLKKKKRAPARDDRQPTPPLESTQQHTLAPDASVDIKAKKMSGIKGSFMMRV